MRTMCSPRPPYIISDKLVLGVINIYLIMYGGKIRMNVWEGAMENFYVNPNREDLNFQLSLSRLKAPRLFSVILRHKSKWMNNPVMWILLTTLCSIFNAANL